MFATQFREAFLDLSDQFVGQRLVSGAFLFIRYDVDEGRIVVLPDGLVERHGNVALATPPVPVAIVGEVGGDLEEPGGKGRVASETGQAAMRAHESVLRHLFGVLRILEELEHAKARGAQILGEVVGYGMSADAYHMTAVAPEGAGAQRAMRAALKDADIQPEQVGYINAHATSTGADPNESRAIELVFGEHATSHKLKVSGTKSMHGHLLGGAGGLEAGITLLALKHQKLPPTINLENVDPACTLDYVPNKAVDHSFEYAMSNSFGFGGINAALVLKRWTE